MSYAQYMLLCKEFGNIMVENGLSCGLERRRRRNHPVSFKFFPKIPAPLNSDRDRRRNRHFAIHLFALLFGPESILQAERRGGAP